MGGMPLIISIVLGCAVAVAVILVILGLRGRFGTPRERGQFELNELMRSDEVPRRTTLREIATCRGHSLDSRALYGAGALWLTRDTLGFVLRAPRRHLAIPVASITSATAASSYHRIGVDEVSDEEDFLVIGWDVSDGPATIAFQVPDPKRWITALDALRS